MDMAMGHVSTLVYKTFEKTIAEDREILEVKLPKGPASYCSEQINGRPPKGCYHVKKTYQMTIEPAAARKLVRRQKAPCDRKFEALPPEAAESSPPLAYQPMFSEVVDVQPQPNNMLVADAMHKREGYYARARFRHQRAPNFEKAKRFPALANHKLVPGWRETHPHHADDSAAHLSMRQRTQRRLVAPTLSLAVRQEAKRSPSPSISGSWHPCNQPRSASPLNGGEIQRENTRTPMLCNEAYSPPLDAIGRDETEESKRRWMGESTFSCPGVPSLSESKMTIARRNTTLDAETVEEEIHEVRERGAENNLKLQCRYEMKLEAYKAEQNKNGHMSNFAKRELGLAEELNYLDHRVVVKPKEEERGFGLNLGFARFRTSDKLEIQD